MVLLNAGAACPMDWWRPEFCAALAGRGVRVIRYDQRETGESTLDPVGEPRHGLPTLVGDAVAILDALDVDEAHWVGFSVGGWIAQLAALDHPERVRALTLMSTQPTGPDSADSDLPGVADRLLEVFAHPAPTPDWSDADAVVDYLVEDERNYAGLEFDEAHVRAIWSDAVRRTPDIRRSMAGSSSGGDRAARWRERLGEIHVPTTVVHGTDDPLFPIGNGEALAREIPDARLVRLEGVGHELPPRAWSTVVEAIAG